MPKMTADVKLAHNALFKNCYFACRALRAIIAYVDGELPRPQWHNNPQISRQLIVAIGSDAFNDEVLIWRNTFAETWQQLQDNGHIVSAMEEQHSRSIGQLTQTYDTVSSMTRALEARLFGILLHNHLQPSVH